MKLRVLGLAAAALAAVLLSGCVSYGYRGGSGDYYYGRGASSHPGYYGYGAPYGSVGYSRYGGWGWSGGVRYGHPYYYGRPGYIYHPGYYYRPPVVVRPRPGHGGHQPPQRPPQQGSDRPPWRDLGNTVRRVEHRERPQRVISSPVGAPRPQGVRQPLQPRPAAAPSRPGSRGMGAPRPAGEGRPVRSPTRPMAPRAPERVMRASEGDVSRRVER